LTTKQQVVEKAKSEGRRLLTEIEAKELLKQAGVNVIDSKLAASSEEAISISRQFGFPVVLKIVSSDIVHKSDAGGVKLGLKTSKQVGKAYNDILAAISQNTLRR